MSKVPLTNTFLVIRYCNQFTILGQIEILNVRFCKSSTCIIKSFYQRFSTKVERCVEHDGATSSIIKCFDQITLNTVSLATQLLNLSSCTLERFTQAERKCVRLTLLTYPFFCNNPDQTTAGLRCWAPRGVAETMAVTSRLPR